MSEELRLMNELTRMARMGGKLMDHITNHVKEVVDKGPIADIREQYAPRAAVEKDIMKVQNAQQKLAQEQKSLN